MRCVELIEASSSGVGRHVMDLSRGLLERGHEVHLVYSEVRADTVFRADLDTLGEYASFHARAIMMRHGLHGQDVLAARSLRRYCASHGPFDLVHCHSTKAGVVGRIGLAGCGVKRIYSAHMFFGMGPCRSAGARRAAALLELGLSKLCDRIIAVSREEYDHAVGLGIAPAKLCLIPNGVALGSKAARPREELRAAWGVHPEETCVGFVGRIVPQKSPDTMLRAFAELLARGTAAPVRLVMIGDGPLAEPCRRLAGQLGVAQRVVWLGEQDAKTLMHAFDMLALTSDSEGHPLVILEAMARGLPVVATRVGGVADTVRAGVNGFVVPVRDISAIAGSLRALVNDPILRENMGRASRVIAQEFSVDRMVERTLDLYHEVTGIPREARRAAELTAAAGR